MKLDFWLPLALAAGATVVSGELSCSACTTSAKVALTAFQKATYLLPSSFEEEIIDVMEDLICRRNMRDRYRSYEDGEKCLKMVEKGGSKALHLQNEDIVQISAEICHSFCDNTNITNGVKGKRNVVMTNFATPKTNVTSKCEKGFFLSEKGCLPCYEPSSCDRKFISDTCVPNSKFLGCGKCFSKYFKMEKGLCVLRGPRDLSDPIYEESKKYINWTEVPTEYFLIGDEKEDRKTLEEVVDWLAYHHEKKRTIICRLNSEENTDNEVDWESKPLLYGLCKSNPTKECFQHARNIMNLKCSRYHWAPKLDSPRKCMMAYETYEHYNATSGEVSGNYCTAVPASDNNYLPPLTVPIRTKADKSSVGVMLKCKACEAGYLAVFQPIATLGALIPESVILEIAKMHEGMSFVAMASPLYLFAVLMSQIKSTLPFGGIPKLAQSFCSQQKNAGSDHLPDCVYDFQNRFNDPDDPVNKAKRDFKKIV